MINGTIAKKFAKRHTLDEVLCVYLCRRTMKMKKMMILWILQVCYHKNATAWRLDTS